MPYTIDTVQKWLDDIANDLPEGLYNNLNGGILLLPEYKISPYAKAGDLYIMGEYFYHYFMGRMIKIYYGSIIRVYGYLGDNEFKEVLKKVLYHEFIHHLESLANENSLDVKDMETLQRYLET